MTGANHERALRRATAWLLAFTVIFMVYASLYPFDFDPMRLARFGQSEWARALAWRRPVRSDLIANLIFYLPFGALATSLAYTAYLVGTDRHVRRTDPVTAAGWLGAGASASNVVFALVSGSFFVPAGATPARLAAIVLISAGAFASMLPPAACVL